LNFYRQRQWSCQVTGKHGLTYEEAATSEQKSKAVSSGQVSLSRSVDKLCLFEPGTVVASPRTDLGLSC